VFTELQLVQVMNDVLAGGRRVALLPLGCHVLRFPFAVLLQAGATTAPADTRACRPPD
jgi:hypothetical protein